MSTAPKRTITIDTNLQGLLKRGKNKTKTNGTTVKPKLKPNQFIRPSTLKKQLLARIKTHQQKKNTTPTSKLIASQSLNHSSERGNSGNVNDSKNKDREINDDNRISQTQVTDIPSVSQNANMNESFSQSFEYLKSLASNARESRHQRKQKNRTHKNNTNIPAVAPAPALAPVNVPVPVPVPVPIQPGPISALPTMPQISAASAIHSSDVVPNVTSPQVFLGSLPNDIDLNIKPNSISFPSDNISNININSIPIVSNVSTPVLNTEPVWGCLKMGTKPTFRTYHNKTLKLHTSVDTSNGEDENKNPDQIPETVNVNSYTTSNTATAETEPSGSEPVSTTELLYGTRQQRLDEYRKEQLNADKEQVESVVKIKQTKQRLVTKRYKLGKYKNKTGDVIGVLIKNAQTQRNVENKRQDMRRLPLDTVMARLHKKRLLKVGSTAPPDVLREMYESSVLAGDIENEGNDIALHNFLADSDKS